MSLRSSIPTLCPGPRRPLVAVLLAALALALALVPAPQGGSAQEPAAPESCSIGVYLLSIHDLDPASGQFGADFWVWANCPGSDYNPLEGVEFSNAAELEVANAYSEAIGDDQYSGQRVSGSFRQDWDLRNFPFDRHVLDIRLEEAQFDTGTFRLIADATNSGIGEDASEAGWRIVALDVMAGETRYDTTWGDPRMAPDSVTSYSRIDARIGIDRTEFGSFFQLTAVVYAAFVLSTLAYFLSMDLPESLDPQFSLIAAALFGIAINLLAARSVLGPQNGLTLVDRIHVAALAFLAVTAVVVLGSRFAFDRGVPKPRIFRWNMVAVVAVVVAFAAINALLIGLAMRAG